MEEEKEISIVEIFKIIKDNILILMITMCIGLVVSAFITLFLIDPKYTATTDIVVNDKQNTGEEINQAQLQTNLTLLNTYQNIVKKSIVLQPAIDEVGADLTTEQLANDLTVTSETDSLVFSISVENSSPYEAANLANAVANNFSSEIKNILNVENVTILTTAEPNEKQTSPNNLLNIAIGTILGLSIGIIWVLLRNIFDRRVHSSDIVEEVGWTLLGTIPEMSRKDLTDTRYKHSVTQKKTNRRRRV